MSAQVVLLKIFQKEPLTRFAKRFCNCARTSKTLRNCSWETLFGLRVLTAWATWTLQVVPRLESLARFCDPQGCLGIFAKPSHIAAMKRTILMLLPRNLVMFMDDSSFVFTKWVSRCALSSNVLNALTHLSIRDQSWSKIRRLAGLPN